MPIPMAIEEAGQVQQAGRGHVSNDRESSRSLPTMEWMAQATNLFDVHDLDYYMSLAREGAQLVRRAMSM